MRDAGTVAMILAAGRGERMRPLTDHTPKPLLKVGGKPLIFWHLDNLSRAGFRRVVINHAHLGGQIEAAVGDGGRWNLEVAYSPETLALETAGGIANALHLIDAEAFPVVNADVLTDYDYRALKAQADLLAHAPDTLAHLVLVDNPAHHPDGDFFLAGRRIAGEGQARLTFSGLGVYRQALFDAVKPGARHALAPLLRAAIAQGCVSGEHHRGRWFDIGTPQRLREADCLLTGKA